MDLTLPSETPHRIRVVHAFIARRVEQTEAGPDLVPGSIALVDPQILETGFKEQPRRGFVGLGPFKLVCHCRELVFSPKWRLACPATGVPIRAPHELPF
jgi:hypothetical protein